MGKTALKSALSPPHSPPHISFLQKLCNGHKLDHTFLKASLWRLWFNHLLIFSEKVWGFEFTWGVPCVLLICTKPCWHPLPKLPCVKLKAPTPSIVPAAKLCPKAGLHVLTLTNRGKNERDFKTSFLQFARSCYENIAVFPSLCPGSSHSYRVRGIELHLDVTHVHPLVSWAEGSCDLLGSIGIQLLRDTQTAISSQARKPREGLLPKQKVSRVCGNPWGRKNQAPQSSELQQYELLLHSVDVFQWPLAGAYFPSSVVSCL